MHDALDLQSLEIRDAPGGAVMSIRAIPRASRTGIAGARGGALLVRVTSPPVEGAANDALLEILSSSLRVPRHSLTIIAGGRSRNKRVRVDGVTSAAVRERIRAHLALP